MDHLKSWINTLLHTIETEVDSDLGKRIIESCGKVCANDGGVLKEVNKLKHKMKDNKDVDLLINEMNKAGIAGGQLKREDNIIYGVYEKCYCPSRKDIDSPIYCNCTQGWAKAVFEIALERPVEVRLEKAIAWGDECCQFVIKY
jgi:predicted hydrocarbon binding protein